MLSIEHPAISQTQINSKRQLLSYLRGGDYAHPGNEEAIEMILGKLEVPIEAPVLDVGCGFGGTLNYLKQKGLQNLYGIDIDATAIAHAKSKYGQIDFRHLDALNVSTIFSSPTFSLILCISSAYAMEDKHKLFSQLAQCAKQGATLILFDYSTYGENPLSVLDFAGKEMYPLNIESIGQDLNNTGWDVVEIRDISLKFVEWYRAFLIQLRSQKDALLAQFMAEDINQVDQTFSHFLDLLKNQSMGGIVVYARRK